MDGGRDPVEPRTPGRTRKVNSFGAAHRHARYAGGVTVIRGQGAAPAPDRDQRRVQDAEAVVLAGRAGPRRAPPPRASGPSAGAARRRAARLICHQRRGRCPAAAPTCTRPSARRRRARPARKREREPRPNSVARPAAGTRPHRPRAARSCSSPPVQAAETTREDQSKSSRTSQPPGRSAAAIRLSDLVALREVLEHEPGVDEVERALLELVGHDVVPADLQVRLRQAARGSRCRGRWPQPARPARPGRTAIGRWSRPRRRPPGTARRQAAGSGRGSSTVAGVEDLLQQVEPAALLLPVVLEEVGAHAPLYSTGRPAARRPGRPLRGTGRQRPVGQLALRRLDGGPESGLRPVARAAAVGARQAPCRWRRPAARSRRRSRW